MKEKYYQIVLWIWLIAISALVISALVASVFE
jgi:hypothetical protein